MSKVNFEKSVEDMTKIITTLNDVCEFIVDCLHKTAPTETDGYPLIRTPNIGKGRLSLEGVQRVSEETYRIWSQRAKLIGI